MNQGFCIEPGRIPPILRRSPHSYTPDLIRRLEARMLEGVAVGQYVVPGPPTRLKLRDVLGLDNLLYTSAFRGRPLPGFWWQVALSTHGDQDWVDPGLLVFKAGSYVRDIDQAYVVREQMWYEGFDLPSASALIWASGLLAHMTRENVVHGVLTSFKNALGGSLLLGPFTPQGYSSRGTVRYTDDAISVPHRIIPFHHIRL